MKLYKNRDWMFLQYIELEKSTTQIAKEIKCRKK